MSGSKKMHGSIESHNMMPKCIRGVNSIMNTILIQNFISYNRFACMMLSNGVELKSMRIDTHTDWINPDGR